MALTSSFGSLDSATRKRLLRLFNRCFIALKRGEVVSEATILSLLPRETPAAVTQEKEAVGGLFFEAIRALLAYFVSSATSEHELGLVQELTNRICSATQRSLGSNLEGWPVSFQNIAQIKQSYWDARASRVMHDIARNRTHRVIRINDIPFAEAVFPALLSWHSNDNGYNVLIEDVPWSEVGEALFTERIDVAIYPGYITNQLKSIRQLFPEKMVVRGSRLLEYRRYPVIRNTGTVEKPSKIAVPRHSDFELVIDEAKSRGFVELRTGTEKGRRIRVGSGIEWYHSADAAMADVINGKIEFGLVGALQSCYATTEYARGTLGGNHFKVELCGVLNRSSPNDCFFWAAPRKTNKADGCKLLSAMTSMWNKQVVDGWKNLANYSVSAAEQRAQSRLVALVNSQSHCSFVSNFEQLRELISGHDVGFDRPVTDICHRVSLLDR